MIGVRPAMMALLAAALLAAPAAAQTDLYRAGDQALVQGVAISGRFHVDVARLDADQGDETAWNLRRLRIGPRITFRGGLTAHVEVELDPQDREPFYVRLTDAYVEWSPGETFALTAGKQSMPFTMDGATSSRRLLTIDRSNLSNNLWFPQEYLPGVSASGEAGRWTYFAGVFSAGASDREFGDFSGGVTTLASAGYDFGDALAVDEAVLSSDYVYQRPDVDNTFARPFAHVGAIRFSLEAGRWGARADLAAGAGYFEQPDLWGVMLMPFVNVTNRFQLVARYTLLDSAGPNGVRLATYENTLVDGRGDRYSEWYAGANYYFFEHRLKLQTGLQWGAMDDAANDGGEYSGVAWVTGVRAGW
jgi:phosphate-selective porin OprO/OprP